MSLGSSTLADTVEDLSQWALETGRHEAGGRIWGLLGVPRGHCTSDDCLLHLYLWLIPSLAGGRDDKGRETFEETLRLLVNSQLVVFSPTGLFGAPETLCSVRRENGHRPALPHASPLVQAGPPAPMPWSRLGGQAGTVSAQLSLETGQASAPIRVPAPSPASYKNLTQVI